MEKIDKENFFESTTGLFRIVKIPKIKPDYESEYSDSKYWFINSGVIRSSGHWGQNIRSCHWFLETKKKDLAVRFENQNNHKIYAGFLKFEDFIKNSKGQNELGILRTIEDNWLTYNFWGDDLPTERFGEYDFPVSQIKKYDPFTKGAIWYKERKYG